MACEHVADFARDRLDEQRRTLYLLHLIGCEKCRKQLQQLVERAEDQQIDLVTALAMLREIAKAVGCSEHEPFSRDIMQAIVTLKYQRQQSQ